MNLFRVMEISGSALLAERLRAEVVSANLANAETTRTVTGKPYQRMHVVFGARPMRPGGFPDFGMMLASLTDMHAEDVRVVNLVADPTPPVKRFEPGHPDADGRVMFRTRRSSGGRNGEPDGSSASLSDEFVGGNKHKKHDSERDRDFDVTS